MAPGNLKTLSQGTQRTLLLVCLARPGQGTQPVERSLSRYDAAAIPTTSARFAREGASCAISEWVTAMVEAFHPKRRKGAPKGAQNCARRRGPPARGDLPDPSVL
jgi:hypothetical protein